jgi:hypothetical protein
LVNLINARHLLAPSNPHSRLAIFFTTESP